MQRVTDIIGEDYKGINNDGGWLDISDSPPDEYGGGNCIFISAPTGSGKTYFIFNEWLRYIAEKNKKMLYLVNRSVLKKQLEKEIIDISPNISSCIDIKSYQNIEYELKTCENNTNENKQRGQKKKNAELENMKQKYSNYDCVVCDECHYFLTDSNYNTDTALSFRWIQDCFADKTRIFMSATIRNIELYIREYDEVRTHEEKMKYYLPNFELAEKEDNFCKNVRKILSSWDSCCCRYRDYEIPRNYDYIDVNIINNTDTIAQIINDGDKTEKWLIFVDKVATGGDLVKKIKDEKNVVFVSSKNKQEEDVSETLEEIKYYEKSKSKRIVIATSVMDNGINIKDMELRNIVLMADTETEFIQMLGRKRKDGKKLKLYIYQYTQDHFEGRLRQTDQILEIATSYLRFLSSCKSYEQYDEEWVIQKRHIKLMREIFDNKISMRHVRSLFNAYGGVLYLNLLAYQNLKNLKSFYQNVISSFEKEENGIKREDCFVRMQLRWLGIEGKKADEIIKESKVTKFDRCYDKVIGAFEEKCNIPMNVDEAKHFQHGIRKELVVLIDATQNDIKEKGKYTTARAQAGKSKCVISRKTMNYLRWYCGIPYLIKIDGKKESKKYIIMKDECRYETSK